MKSFKAFLTLIITASFLNCSNRITNSPIKEASYEGSKVVDHEILIKNDELSKEEGVEFDRILKLTDKKAVGCKPCLSSGFLAKLKDFNGYTEIGRSSWYGDTFQGKKTASGEVYNAQDLTAAHPTLPLPSIVRVTNLDNNKTVIVKVNDRGPFSKNRVIDVSKNAAKILDFHNKGTTTVKVEFLVKETEILLKNLK